MNNKKRRIESTTTTTTSSSVFTSATSSSSSLQAIPTIVIDNIQSYLTVIFDKMNLAIVNKNFYLALKTYRFGSCNVLDLCAPSFVINADVAEAAPAPGGATKTMSYITLTTLLKNYGDNVRGILLALKMHVKAHEFQQILRLLPSLTSISIALPFKVGGFGQSITLPASSSNVACIERIDLHFAQSFNDSTLRQFLNLFNGIKRFSVKYCNVAKQTLSHMPLLTYALEEVNVSGTQVSFNSLLPSINDSCEKLEVFHGSGVRNLIDRSSAPSPCLRRLSKLRVLNFNNSCLNCNCFEQFIHVLRGEESSLGLFSPIQELYLTRIELHDSASSARLRFEQLIHKLGQTLRVLVIDYVMILEPSFFISLGQNCPNLEFLNAKGTKIDMNGYNALKRALPRLKMQLDACRSLPRGFRRR